MHLQKSQQRKREVGGQKMVVTHTAGDHDEGRGFYRERVTGEGIFSKRLCAGASLRLCETLPDQCTGMDYTSL